MLQMFRKGAGEEFGSVRQDVEVLIGMVVNVYKNLLLRLRYPYVTQRTGWAYVWVRPTQSRRVVLSLT